MSSTLEQPSTDDSRFSTMEKRCGTDGKGLYDPKLLALIVCQTKLLIGPGPSCDLLLYFWLQEAIWKNILRKQKRKANKNRISTGHH